MGRKLFVCATLCALAFAAAPAAARLPEINVTLAFRRRRNLRRRRRL
jgi:hypothetical protein